MVEQQQHLNFNKQINLGSYYTPKHLVENLYEILKRNVGNLDEYIILDSSCGYGSFFKTNKNAHFKGADIDSEALKRIKQKEIELYNTNSLKDVDRVKYNIKENEKLIIVGNPPYNDTTSIIRQGIKDKTLNEQIDGDIKTRDLGMSFLLSYDKLKANFVCVLHPLSYLIKASNFKVLSKFAKNYVLIDNLIVSSHEFVSTSKGMAFPIIIALYKREKTGMNYEYIKNYQFKTKEKTTLKKYHIILEIVMFQ